MTIGQLIAFNLALLAAIISPGPALLVAIQTTLSVGRRAGIAIGCGLGLMAATWTLAALLGLDAAFRLFPWAYTLVKTMGAIYLIFLAIKMWRRSRDSIESRKRIASDAFLQGLSVNLLNPKSVLFAAAVLVVVFPQNMSTTENAIVVGNHILIELVFYTSLAFAISLKSVSAKYIQAKVYLDRASSIVLGGLGVRLLTDR